VLDRSQGSSEEVGIILDSYLAIISPPSAVNREVAEG